MQLSLEALQLLRSVDRGGVPAFVSERLQNRLRLLQRDRFRRFAERSGERTAAGGPREERRTDSRRHGAGTVVLRPVGLRAGDPGAFRYGGLQHPPRPHVGKPGPGHFPPF